MIYVFQNFRKTLSFGLLGFQKILCKTQMETLTVDKTLNLRGSRSVNWFSGMATSKRGGR